MLLLIFLQRENRCFFVFMLLRFLLTKDEL
nr:MAG TPA: protein of unknown function (DUF4927) [Caudoviricetes sp.]